MEGAGLQAGERREAAICDHKNVAIAAEPRNPSPSGPSRRALTVLFDGRCQLCRGTVRRLQPLDRQNRIEWLDLHDPSVPQRFPFLNLSRAMQELQALDMRGRVHAGVDAFLQIGGQLPGWRGLSWLLSLPGLHLAASTLYRCIARNRYRWNRNRCETGICTGLGGQE